MAVSGDAVRVEGLRELRRDLGRVDKVLPKKLRGRLKTIGDKVAGIVRGRMPSRSGRARGSVKSGVSGNNAYIQGGRKTVPYFGWLDFGGVLRPTGRRRGTQSRPRLKAGRYIYPAIRQAQPDTQRAAVAAFEETKRDLGLK